MSTFNKPFTTEESYKKATESLYNELKSVSKNISYLDVYNIVDVVENKDELNAKLNALTKNSSLVINTPPFQEQGEYYNTGDILLKNNQDKIVHIAAQAGGVYYPSQLIKKDGNYDITYTYNSSAPTTDGETADDNGKVKFAKSLTFPLAIQDQTGNYIYGLWLKSENNHSFSFKIETYTKKIESSDETIDIKIQPQVQFWLCADDEGNQPIEQVYIDYILSEYKEKSVDYWKITLAEGAPYLWIKVK